MTLRDVFTELSAKILCGSDEQLDAEVATAAAGDLMSDILARLGSPDVLLTGLTNTQAVRTSSVSGIKSILVVRGKPVNDSMIELAREEDITLAVTELSMFTVSGRLYAMGLRSGMDSD
ncbi:MAG: hypothetical protein KAY24_01770 [Candidatus Eisenbacteria sp.]|nr:hypothetical protein [Candidatus Eisenbacteria bacterium]